MYSPNITARATATTLRAQVGVVVGPNSRASPAARAVMPKKSRPRPTDHCLSPAGSALPGEMAAEARKDGLTNPAGYGEPLRGVTERHLGKVTPMARRQPTAARARASLAQDIRMSSSRRRPARSRLLGRWSADSPGSACAAGSGDAYLTRSRRTSRREPADPPARLSAPRGRWPDRRPSTRERGCSGTRSSGSIGSQAPRRRDRGPS